MFNDPRILPKRKQKVGMSDRRGQTTCSGLRQFCNLSPYMCQYCVFLLVAWTIVLGVDRTVCVFKQIKKTRGLSSISFQCQSLRQRGVEVSNCLSSPCRRRRRSLLGLFLHWFLHHTTRGTRWRSFEALRYKPKGRGFDSRWCH